MSNPDWASRKADEIVDAWIIRRPHEDLRAQIAAALRDARAGGLEKAAANARYHRDKHGGAATRGWVAACQEFEITCLAAAGRVRRRESEDPATDVSW